VDPKGSTAKRSSGLTHSRRAVFMDSGFRRNDEANGQRTQHDKAIPHRRRTARRTSALTFARRGGTRMDAPW
jgi:hypothetical protein